MPPQRTVDLWTYLREKARAYYEAKLQEFGPTPRGVDWNSYESQMQRFAILLDIVEEPTHEFSINDWGCGYGALVDYLEKEGLDFSYHGIDVSPMSIAETRKRFPAHSHCTFSTDFVNVPVAEYTVASGVFNVRQDSSDEEWTEYVHFELDRLAAVSRKGFAFNLLTSLADPEHMRPDLYYGNPSFFVAHCLSRYSRRLALLHDYGLYEFTILVRSNGQAPWRSS